MIESFNPLKMVWEFCQNIIWQAWQKGLALEGDLAQGRGGLPYKTKENWWPALFERNMKRNTTTKKKHKTKHKTDLFCAFFVV